MTAERVIAIIQSYTFVVPVNVEGQIVKLQVQIAEDMAKDIATRLLAEDNG